MQRAERTARPWDSFMVWLALASKKGPDVMATALAFWVVGTACVETVDEVVCVTIDDTTGDTVKSSSGEIICDAPE